VAYFFWATLYIFLSQEGGDYSHPSPPLIRVSLSVVSVRGVHPIIIIIIIIRLIFYFLDVSILCLFLMQFLSMLRLRL